MGYTMRTAAWRFTEWVSFDPLTATPDWSTVPQHGRELYDHRAAPPATFVMEGENLSERPEHAALVAELSRALRAGWRASVPGRFPAEEEGAAGWFG